MIYNQCEYELGYSLKPPKWLRKAAKKVAHSVSVNAKNAYKGVNKVIDVTPVGIAWDLVQGNKTWATNAIKVNAKNAKKALKKISMNKLVDKFTPEIPIDASQYTESPLKKYAPIALSAVALLPLLFGDD